uniref:Putative secreted protein n=1 Tax=Ixodes ricinus TaxID=34613 RepID=V5H0I9_IXORI
MFRCVLVLALATCAFAGYLSYGGYSVAAPLELLLLHRPPCSSCFYPRLRPWSWLRLWSRIWPPPRLRLWTFRLWPRLRSWTRPSRLRRSLLK